MNKQNRINYIIDLYQKMSGEPADFTTKINNASINSICMYEGPAYFRVKNWLEKKIGEKVQTEKKGELDIDKDIKAFHDTLKECLELARERMPKYGNSWRILDIKSLALLMMMKLDRIAELGENNAKTKDELQDVVNYATFSLIRFNEKNNG